MGKYMTDADWEHSKYFEKKEFRCPCGKCSGYPTNGIYKSLVDNMNFLRHYFGKSITITSGYRCEYGNKLVNGDANSAHLTGGACDWNFTGETFTEKQKNEIIYMIRKMPNYHWSYSNQTNMFNAIHIDTLLVDCADWNNDTTNYENKIKELDKQILELKATINEIEKLNVEANEKIISLNKQLTQFENEKQELLNEIEIANNKYRELFHIGKLCLCIKQN